MLMIGLYFLLNVAVLGIVARASSTSGWRLAAMLFLLGFVVGSANNLLEAAVYGVLTPGQLAGAAIPAGIIFAILSPAAVLLAGRWKGSDVVVEEGGLTPLTLLGVVVAYELLYWTAGTLVYPYVADFYATRTIPPPYVIAALQVVRSFILAQHTRC